MTFNIVSNLNNGAGLQCSYELLRHELERRGHQVQGVQFNSAKNVSQADVNIFIETVKSELFQYARKQWVIPMPEWWDIAWFDLKFDRVLALTRDCHWLFSDKFGETCTYLGWKARDLYDGAIPRERKFLHVAGKSSYKNTAAVVEGCGLAEVSLTQVVDRSGGKHRISDEELRQLMNSHQFHVMPSAYEGYGYVLHEALGVGAVLITTDAPPMNEVQPSILVKSIGARPRHATVLHSVSSQDIADAIKKTLQLSAEEIRQYSERARWQFVLDEQEFHLNLDKVLAEG